MVQPPRAVQSKGKQNKYLNLKKNLRPTIFILLIKIQEDSINNCNFFLKFIISVVAAIMNSRSVRQNKNSYVPVSARLEIPVRNVELRPIKNSPTKHTATHQHYHTSDGQ